MHHSDEEIKKHIIDHLYWDNRIDASDISVEVKQGKAILKGTVPTYFTAVCARENALDVTGVTEVIDDITISFPGTLKRPTDGDIRTRIVSTLALNPDFDASRINTTVEDGVVTLEGSVEAPWQKDRAEYLASQERGVTAIQNNLAVVPTENYVDHDIAADIVSALERNALVDQETVTVEVQDGVVNLSGMVPSPAAKRTVRKTAQFTPGVIDVKDDVRIA